MGEIRRNPIWAAAVVVVALVMTLLTAPANAANGSTLVVDPSTGLVDLQQVVISGGGFDPGSTYGVCEAIEGDLGTDACGFTLTLASTADGSFSLTAPVHQFMYVSRVGRVVDCRVDSCVIVAAEVNGIDPILSTAVTVPIGFAPAPPPPSERGTISVNPASGLVSGQATVVSGLGFRPDVPVEVVQYAGAPTQPGDCSWGATLTRTDADGAFATTVVVQGVISTTGGQDVVNCLDQVGTCSLAAGETTDVFGTLASTPLGFVPPPPPHGHLIVTPHRDLLDAQLVTVEGSGFNPSASIGICQAVAGATGAESCGLPISFTASSTDGSFTTSYLVNRSIHPTAVAPTIDCAVERCVIAVAEVPNIAETIVETPLTFASAHQLPVLTPGVGHVVEGDAGTVTVDVPVTLSKPADGEVDVTWSTVRVAGGPHHQARAGRDYEVASGVLSIPSGQTSGVVTVTVRGDLWPEHDEYLVVSFTHADNAFIGGFWGLGFGVIVDDD